MVEWPPATRSARVQFPDDAYNFFVCLLVCLVFFSPHINFPGKRMAWKTEEEIREQGKLKSFELEAPGIDPGTSHMLSERSTT